LSIATSSSERRVLLPEQKRNTLAGLSRVSSKIVNGSPENAISVGHALGVKMISAREGKKASERNRRASTLVGPSKKFNPGGPRA
jgi:hypothetical protein